MLQNILINKKTCWFLRLESTCHLPSHRQAKTSSEQQTRRNPLIYKYHRRDFSSSTCLFFALTSCALFWTFFEHWIYVAISLSLWTSQSWTSCFGIHLSPLQDLYKTRSEAYLSLNTQRRKEKYMQRTTIELCIILCWACYLLLIESTSSQSFLFCFNSWWVFGGWFRCSGRRD